MSDQQKDKKPPVHEIIIKALNGDFKEELDNLSLDDWETPAIIGFLISKCHIPEDQREPLAEALINSALEKSDDDVTKAVKMALEGLNQSELLLKRLQAEEVDSDNYNLLKEIAEAMKLEIPEVKDDGGDGE